MKSLYLYAKNSTQLILLMWSFMLSFKIYSQSAANYTPAHSTGITFSTILGSGTAIASGSWRAASDDDSRTTAISIGFDFWYLGVKYSTFSVSTNGFIDLSSSTANGTGTSAFGYENPEFYGTSSTVLCLAPLYDDLEVPTSTSNASVAYSVSGSAPNRVLTVEWLAGLSTCADATCNTYNFQVKLNESTGVIEYWYGSMTGNLTYNCGLNGPTVSSNPTAAQYLNQSTANSATFGTGQAGLTTVPSSNTKIVFTPPASVTAPTSLTFASVASTSMTLNWTASSPTTNIIRYGIYNSTDNTTFTYVTDVALGTNTYAATGLTPSTTYYWKVYAISEGTMSSALSNSQATTATPTITSTATGNWNTGSTWVGGVVPTSTDNVQIANGHTITIDAAAACYGLTVGQGTSGILQFEQTTARTLTVTNNVTIAAGGTFQSNTAGTQTGHVLSLGGNIVNSGTLDFSTNTNTAAAGITFTGSSNATFSGTGGTTDIRTITINKGTTTSSILELSTSNFTVRGVSTDVAAFLTLTKGTFKISGSFTMTNRVIAGAATTIAATTGIYLNNANFTVAAQAGSLTLSGLLQIDAGTYNVGTSSTTHYMTGASTAVFTMSGGALNVYGCFNFSQLVYTQSGGTLTAVTGSNSSGDSFLLNTASTFTMSGGTIVLRFPGSGGMGDYFNFASTRNITGGTVQYGDASSGVAKTFTVSSGYFPNLNVSSTSGNHIVRFSQIAGIDPYIYLNTTVSDGATLDGGTTYWPTMTFVGDVTIGSGSTFLAANPHTFKGNFTNNGTFTANGGTVTFNGSATQTISGSSTTSFYNLTTANAPTVVFSVPTNITNNLTLGGTSTVDANAALNIDGVMTIGASTTFMEGANTHTVAGNWVDNGTFTEEGGTINFDGATQTISGSSVNFNNFTHSGAGTTTLGADVDINGNVSLSAGSLAQSSYSMTVAGNWTSSGDYFAEGTGTVTFDGTGTSTVTGTSSTIGGSTGNSLFTESFENGGSIPSGWTTATITNATTYAAPTLTYVSSTTYPTLSTASAGTYFVKFNSYSCDAGDQSRLYRTTSFSTSTYSNIVVNFDWYRDNAYSGNNDYVNVQYSTNGSTWTTVGSNITRYAASNGWTSQSVTLPVGAENQATIYIAFLYTSAYGNNTLLDNVRVTGDVAGVSLTGETFSKFAIAKSGAGYVQLSSDMCSESNFALTSGLVKTGAYTFVLGTNTANAAISGGSSSSYIAAFDNGGVIGYVKQFVNSNAAYSYPIGDATCYTPLTFTLTAGTLSSAYVTVYTKDVKIPGLNSVITAYLDRFWEVTPSGITSPTYDISYSYVDADLVGSETGMLPVKKSGTTYYKPTGSSFTNGTVQGTGAFDAESNTLTWSSLTTFSDFGGVPNAVVALPVELLSFKGEKDGNNNTLFWQTASEINSDFFTLEKSYDGSLFEIIGTKEGSGNSTHLSEYAMTDYDVRKVINYYRLKQTDFDGKYTFSEIITVDNSINTSLKDVWRKTNILGQEVNEFYRGVVIFVYSDGTSVKMIQ